ncbi:hypothetical protein BD779DRAFT_1477232 [Infundibulicybe gibba]|nr:hypothetical protein BD779DRAFT_1477232 [Infundibulicybe gibba]
MGLDDYKYTVKLYRVWNPVDGQGTAGERLLPAHRRFKARLEGSVTDIAKIYEEDWNREDITGFVSPFGQSTGGRRAGSIFRGLNERGILHSAQRYPPLRAGLLTSVIGIRKWTPASLFSRQENFRPHDVELLAKDIYDYNIYFKPVCDIRCEGTVSATALGNFTFLSEHVLGFYKTYVFNDDLPHVNGAFIERFFPSSKRSINPERTLCIRYPAGDQCDLHQNNQAQNPGARPAFRTPQQVAQLCAKQLILWFQCEFWATVTTRGILKATENLTILEEKRNGTSDSSVYTQPQFPTNWKRPQLFWIVSTNPWPSLLPSNTPGLIDQLQIDEVNYTGDVLPESPHQSPEDITPKAREESLLLKYCLEIKSALWEPATMAIAHIYWRFNIQSIRPILAQTQSFDINLKLRDSIP